MPIPTGKISYKKVFWHGQGIDAIQSILIPIAKCLLKETLEYSLTIAYKLLEHILGVDQYFPVGSGPNPENRLFVHFHASQTLKMKEEILKQLSSKASTIPFFCNFGYWDGCGHSKYPPANLCWTSLY